MLFWADLVFGVRIITDRDSGQSKGFAGANAEIDAAIYDVNNADGEKSVFRKSISVISSRTTVSCPVFNGSTCGGIENGRCEFRCRFPSE